MFETGCKGRTVPMEKLDTLVADHIEHRLLQPSHLEKILSSPSKSAPTISRTQGMFPYKNSTLSRPGTRPD
jgi:hypothetical protein